MDNSMPQRRQPTGYIHMPLAQMPPPQMPPPQMPPPPHIPPPQVPGMPGQQHQHLQQRDNVAVATMMMFNAPQAQMSASTAQSFGLTQPAAQLMASDVNRMQQHGVPASAAVPIVEGKYQHSARANQLDADDVLEQRWREYQKQLKTIFRDVQAGSLESAAELLLSCSRWLLSQVKDLGLTVDDQTLYDDRIDLWNDFNHAWLATFQKQREMIESGKPLSRSQNLIPMAKLKEMGDKLVAFCDGIERHGLVDYQYGVWEEQIISSLESCLDSVQLQHTSRNIGRRKPKPSSATYGDY